MVTYESDTVEALVASYQSDVDNGHRVDLRTYTTATPIGDLRFDPKGPQGGWRLAIFTDGYWVERTEEGRLTGVELAEEIGALLERANPTARQTVTDLLEQIRDMVAERDDLTIRIETAAVDAVKAGASKINTAAAAGISRPYLDKLLARS